MRAALKSYLRNNDGGLLRRALGAYRKYRMRLTKARFDGRASKDVFTEIYVNSIWGEGDTKYPYYSGSGSHDPDIVQPYVKACRTFLESLQRPDVVDIGCGDFAVGSQLRAYCGSYVAADVVEPLIKWDKETYRDLDVDFRLIDLANDELPDADLVFVRQVFQHMANADIIKALKVISSKYKYLIATEEVPARPDFKANLDKPVGPDIRLNNQSGVVLTQPPFNLAVKNSEVLCEVPAFDGLFHSRIRTIAYEL